MAEMQGPFELLDLSDGQSVSFRVVRWTAGEMTIFPPHQPGGKIVGVIRVHVPTEDKPAFPHYYDFTAATLRAQMEAHLKRPDLARLRFKITAQGIQPKKRFQVDVTPS